MGYIHWRSCEPKHLICFRVAVEVPRCSFDEYRLSTKESQGDSTDQSLEVAFPRLCSHLNWTHRPRP